MECSLLGACMVDPKFLQRKIIQLSQCHKILAMTFSRKSSLKHEWRYVPRLFNALFEYSFHFKRMVAVPSLYTRTKRQMTHSYQHPVPTFQSHSKKRSQRDYVIEEHTIKEPFRQRFHMNIRVSLKQRSQGDYVIQEHTTNESLIRTFYSDITVTFEEKIARGLCDPGAHDKWIADTNILFRHFSHIRRKDRNGMIWGTNARQLSYLDKTFIQKFCCPQENDFKWIRSNENLSVADRSRQWSYSTIPIARKWRRWTRRYNQNAEDK